MRLELCANSPELESLMRSTQGLANIAKLSYQHGAPAHRRDEMRASALLVLDTICQLDTHEPIFNSDALEAFGQMIEAARAFNRGEY